MQIESPLINKVVCWTALYFGFKKVYMVCGSGIVNTLGKIKSPKLNFLNHVYGPE